MTLPRTDTPPTTAATGKGFATDSLGIGSIVLGVPITALLRVYFPDFFRHGRRTVTERIVTDD